MMTLLPQQHVFTPDNESSIDAFGYQIIDSNQSNTGFVNFMQVNYPNFNLLSLLQIVEQILTPTTSLPIRREIHYNTTTGKLVISFYNAFITEMQATVFQRTFYKIENHIIVNHDYFLLPSTHQQNRLAQPVFQESLQQYINMDAYKIVVHAGLTGGGYIWAKHGFIITERTDADAILALAKKQLFPAQLQFIERIYHNYYNNPDPDFYHKAFPIILWANLPFMKPVLRGSHWHGELNLKNQEQLANFTDYVFRN